MTAPIDPTPDPPDAIALAPAWTLPRAVPFLTWPLLGGAALWLVLSLPRIFSEAGPVPSLAYAVGFAMCFSPIAIARYYAKRRDEPLRMASPEPGLLTITTRGGREVVLSLGAIAAFEVASWGDNPRGIDLVLRDGARFRISASSASRADAEIFARRLTAAFLDKPHVDKSPAPPERIEGVTIREEEGPPAAGYRAAAGGPAIVVEWSADPRQTYRSVALTTMAGVAGVLALAHQATGLRVFSAAVGAWCVAAALYALVRLIQSDAHVRVRLDDDALALSTGHDRDPAKRATVPLSAIRSLTWTAAGKLELRYDEPSAIGAPMTLALPMLSLSFVDQIALDRLLSAELARRKGAAADDM